MSTPSDYLTFLTRSGVKLWVENGQLRYHAKKGVFSAEELTRLRSMKSEIIAELSRARPSTKDELAPAGAMSATEVPTSFQQQWLLRLVEAYPNWRATLSYVFHLKGALDPTALERSLEAILCMHASLRTRIVCVRGECRQEVEPCDGFRLPIRQVSGEAASERQQNALLLIQESAARELDPGVAPLMGAQLIQVSAHEHFLVLLIHRLATDCLGAGQVLRDLWALYAQATQQGASASLEGSARYRDYALRQQTTDGAWREKHAAYWHDYLVGARPILWPVGEYASPATRDEAARLTSLEVSFGVALSARLRELGRQTQTLPALVILTVYVAAVSRWCGQKDLLMPFVIAGRAASHEGVVGCFSQLVYLRIRLEGAETFIELLKRVSNEYYKGAAFRQDSARVALERPELLRGTLCQWLAWHPADMARSEADGKRGQLGLEVEKMRCQNLEELTNVPPDLVDIEVNFFDMEGDISALAIYRSDRFAEGVPARLMGELRSIAEYVVRDSGAPIAGWRKG